MGETNNNGKKKEEILYIKVYTFITQFQTVDYTVSSQHGKLNPEIDQCGTQTQYILFRVRIIHENRENNQKMGQTNNNERTRNGIIYM